MSETNSNGRVQSYAETQRAPSDSVSDALINRIIEATEQRIASRPSPLSLDTWEQIEAFAERASRSNMVPRDYQGKPDNIILAIMKGKEVGLPAIQALESIAIVNGRSAIWGDAVPGLCFASGKLEDYREYFEGQEGTDAFTAVCEVKRRGIEIKVGRFSQKDAKVAGLFGQAVHGKYPKRMMQWRARVAFRDAFPDVLRGLGVRETEAEDAVATPGWTMPQPEKGWFSAKVKAVGDAWDDTWFTGVVAKLAGEPNAWKWMDLLIVCLAEAPTLRDVQEIAELPVVARVLETAPDDAKASINTAIDEAKARTASTDTVERDTAGVAWDERLHASSKAKNTDGTWRARRGMGSAIPETAPESAGAPQQAETQSQASPLVGIGMSGAFSEYLVDGEGTELADGDGVIEPITDPMVFVRTYADVRADMFPADIELFDRANHDALAKAQALAPGAAAIIVAARGGTVAAPAPAETADPARVFAPPSKPTKADYDKYKASLEGVLAGMSTPDGINRAVDLNEPVYGAFPPSHRLACKALIEARQKAISPPPARGVVSRSSRDVADSALRDIAAIDTVADLDTWQASGPVKAELSHIELADPAQYRRVMEAKGARLATLMAPKPEATGSLFGDEPAQPDPRAEGKRIQAKMLAALEACQSRDDVRAWGAKADTIADGSFLASNYPDLWKSVQELGNTRHKPVAS